MKTEGQIRSKLQECNVIKSELDDELLSCDDMDDREWIYSKMAFNSLRIEMLKWILEEIKHIRIL